jgi:Tfp pilus assembly protein PilF
VWHALFVAVRVAAACDDSVSARAWLTQLLALHPTLPEVLPQRLHPARGLQGTVAWLEGRPEAAVEHWQAALAEESSCDLMSQAVELRVRLAAARLRAGDMAQAATWLTPVLARADEGPRGAVFAAASLAELAQTDWRGQLTPLRSDAGNVA